MNGTPFNYQQQKERQMTTENTLENKKRFMGAHWGQTLWYTSEYGSFTSGWGIHISRNIVNPTSYLLLTPLSLITDEDAKAVQSILNLSDNEVGFDTSAENIKKEIILVEIISI